MDETGLGSGRFVEAAGPPCLFLLFFGFKLAGSEEPNLFDKLIESPVLFIVENAPLSGSVFGAGMAAE
jgi:hypothetical protein